MSLDEKSSNEMASIRDFRPLPGPMQQYSLEFIRRHRALLLSESPGKVLVGITRSPTCELRFLLRSFHHKPVAYLPITDSDLAAHLARISFGSSRTTKPLTNNLNRLLLDRMANDAPVVDFVNGLLVDAIRLEASDIHLETIGDSARVRYRVDGQLVTTETFGQELFPAISTRVKLMAKLNIMEHRIPQDGRVSFEVEGENRSIRVSTVPSATGESIVIRLLPADREVLTLQCLGFQPEEVASLERITRRPSGLILATGPTGSGKSTTLAALLRLLSREDTKVVSIEDPVERRLPGVVQIQTNEAIGLTFDRLLRHVLRQDPNVVMVGEIRDASTCELVVRASLTGHLVLSTLHTNGAVSSISRLRNLGTPSYLIAEVLIAAIAQRLVRRLCPDCKRRVDPEHALQGVLESRGLQGATLFEPVGCRVCRGSGYLGRVPITEIFVVDETTRDLVHAGAAASVVAAQRQRTRLRTIHEDALEKLAGGVTSKAEIMAIGEDIWNQEQ